MRRLTITILAFLLAALLMIPEGAFAGSVPQKKAELKLLRSGKGKAESGVYFSEYLTVSRRVVEHNRNIAETLLAQPAQ